MTICILGDIIAISLLHGFSASRLKQFGSVNTSQRQTGWLLQTLDGVNIVLRDEQYCAFTSIILDGSSGICKRLLQWFKERNLSFESLLMPAGKLKKLFLLRFNVSNEDKLQISKGTAPSIRLQSLISSSLKEHKPDKEGNCKPMVSELFLGNNQNEKSELHELDASPLHPPNDNISRFLKRTIEEGGCLTSVPSA